MSYLVTAWSTDQPAQQHLQHLITIAAVQRLIQLLVCQTDVNYITIRIIPDISDHQIPLPQP